MVVSETAITDAHEDLDARAPQSSALILEHAVIIFVRVTVFAGPTPALDLLRSPAVYASLPVSGASEHPDLEQVKTTMFGAPLPDHLLMYFRNGQPWEIMRPLELVAAIATMLSSPRPHLTPREVQVFMVTDAGHMDLIPEEQRRSYHVQWERD